jgi:hypothetical protein
MKKILVLVVSLLAGLPWAEAQEKVTIERSEEEMDTTRFAYLLDSYNRVIRAKEEKRQLIKIDLIGPVLYLFSLGERNDSTKNHVHTMVRVAFERKIKPALSYVVATTIGADNRRIRDVGISGGLRYYYNLNRRILKGKSANNFSANYLSTFINGRTRPGRDQQDISIHLVYGIQRRITKWGYIDADVGLAKSIVKYPDRKAGLNFNTSIQLGLAF